MVNVVKRMCRTEGCSKHPLFGVAGTKTAEYCTLHAPDGMVNVRNRMCKTEGCGKKPLFGVAGTKTAEYCTQHALDVMVNVINRTCRTEGCSKHPSFGVAGTKTAKFCAKHALYGMVDVKNRMRKTEGSSMISAFEVAGTNAAEHCVQHNRPRYGVEGYKGRGIGPNSRSGGSRGSRKRERYIESMPTALKGAVVLDSAAGVVTMPKIDGQKPPVKRDTSVKTEVHISL